jgi:hypothetical protein
MPINWELAGNPVNWVIIPVMLAFGGFAVSLVVNGFDIEKSLGMEKSGAK